MTEYNNHREILNLGDLVSKLFKEKAELEKRVQALESVISGIKSVKIDTTIPESTLVNIQSDLTLESVKQQVTELLKSTDLPDWAKYVSVDGDGEVNCYKLKPEIDEDLWNSGTSKYIKYATLNGADWKKCVWKISDLLGVVKKNFTTETRDKLIAFMDDLREYVHESHTDISKDERDSSEFVDIFLSKNESVDSNKMIPDTQPDWENLLDVYDLEEVKKSAINASFSGKNINLTSANIEIYYLNQKIYQLIKPLLEDYECDSFYLEEAKTRIAELEALNKTYELSILNRTQKPNQIDVPFELDEDGDIYLSVKSYQTLYGYCREKYIDQTKIERIILQMKSEEE